MRLDLGLIDGKGSFYWTCVVGLSALISTDEEGDDGNI